MATATQLIPFNIPDSPKSVDAAMVELFLWAGEGIRRTTVFGGI
jgi:hypothetical protein